MLSIILGIAHPGQGLRGRTGKLYPTVADPAAQRASVMAAC
jgi:hypothetical protein